MDHLNGPNLSYSNRFFYEPIYNCRASLSLQSSYFVPPRGVGSHDSYPSGGSPLIRSRAWLSPPYRLRADGVSPLFPYEQTGTTKSTAIIEKRGETYVSDASHQAAVYAHSVRPIEL